MNSSSQIMLAIAPGKRELGIAVFEETDLIYVAVKTIGRRKKGKTTLKELSFTLKKLFAEFPVKVVVMKAVSQYQKLSPELNVIAERIRLEAVGQSRLKIDEITIEQIKSAFCKSGKPTQHKAFLNLLSFYPELKRYWNRPNKWQNDYYAFLFSAVAVGAVYLKTQL